MRIRKEFVLRGELWKVEYKWGLRMDGVVVNGLCHFDSKTIEIRRELSKEDKWVTFLHELVHAVLFECYISRHDGGIDGIVEEVVCDSIAEALDSMFAMRWKR